MKSVGIGRFADEKLNFWRVCRRPFPSLSPWLPFPEPPPGPWHFPHTGPLAVGQPGERWWTQAHFTGGLWGSGHAAGSPSPGSLGTASCCPRQMGRAGMEPGMNFPESRALLLHLRGPLSLALPLLALCPSGDSLLSVNPGARASQATLASESPEGLPRQSSYGWSRKLAFLASSRRCCCCWRGPP